MTATKTVFAVLVWNGMNMAADVPAPPSPWLTEEDVLDITRAVLEANFKEHMWHRFNIWESDTRHEDDSQRTCLYVDNALITDFLNVEIHNSPY